MFTEYEAVNYPENGKEAFWNAIHSKEYLDMLDMYGAYDGNEPAGIIATRNGGTHIALFFVAGRYHRKGIGKQLFQICIKENRAQQITVHSSFYAAEIYRKLGFVDTDGCQEEGGIQYIPMIWRNPK